MLRAGRMKGPSGCHAHAYIFSVFFFFGQGGRGVSMKTCCFSFSFLDVIKRGLSCAFGKKKVLLFFFFFSFFLPLFFFFEPFLSSLLNLVTNMFLSLFPFSSSFFFFFFCSCSVLALRSLISCSRVIFHYFSLFFFFSSLNNFGLEALINLYRRESSIVCFGKKKTFAD